MGLYNFQPRFVQPILDGTKKHTIRAIRVHPDKPGNTLHLYTGLRRKGAKLIRAAVCTKVQDIEILHNNKQHLWAVLIDGYPLAIDEREQLARRDGFVNFAEMMTFWEGRLPFKGHIIHWSARPFVSYTTSDVCWCPQDGLPANPKCPMHGERKRK